MKKRLWLIMMFALILSGCTAKSPDISKPEKVEINSEKLMVQAVLVSQNQETYTARIEIDNQTGYPFLPSGVFAVPYIETQKENTITQNDLPFLIEAFTVKADNNKYQYNVTIPKKTFELYPNIEKDNIRIDVRGHFINKNGQIISQISGKGTYLELK